jgi:hypothetical protein
MTNKYERAEPAFVTDHSQFLNAVQRMPMIKEWISEKGTSLIAFIVGLGFVLTAFLDRHYRYFHILMAILALVYGYRQFKKKDTPFERRERELRRRRL